MTSIRSVPRSPHLHRLSQGADTSALAPAQSRKRPLPGADAAAISGLSRRPRTGSAAEATAHAPRSLPKARARALALSAARKMAAEPEIAQLHGAALGAMDGGAGENIVALPATALPPSFFKHSTSGNDLLNNLFQRDKAGQDAVFNPVVNRGGQTLLERWTSHMTTRWDPDAGKQRWYSNSYEAKRIELIRTALAALVQHPTP